MIPADDLSGPTDSRTPAPDRERIRDRFRAGLSRTRARFAGRLGAVLGGRAREADLDQIEEVLFEADVGVAACERIVEGIQARTRNDSEISTLDAVRAEVRALLGEAPPPLAPLSAERPRVILVVGVNGSGKTTTIGKLAHRYTSEGRKVVIAAADTFRAAAIEQLEVWAERAGAHFIRQTIGADPAAVTFDALESARARGADVLLVDTAGRLHNKANLMEELRKIRRVMNRKDSSYPHETLLVLDAVTGQNGVIQARQFHDVVGLTGIALTKLDGTAKGGVVVAVASELDIPVRLIGVGERVEDLQDFDPESFAEALLSP